MVSREPVASRAGLLAEMTERLRNREANRLAHIVDLFVACGQAQQAASDGDDAALARALQDAADLEYAAFGDCDAVGDVSLALGIGEVTDDEPA